MKTLLRKADVRTIEATSRTIGALLDCFTPDRMRKLLQKRRIRFSLTRSRFGMAHTTNSHPSHPPDARTWRAQRPKCGVTRETVIDGVRIHGKTEHAAETG
jgi:hypothetical protein